MTDLRQAAQQALEALYNMVEDGDRTDKQQAMLAITALHTALEQPEQEPTPWRDMVVATLVREGVNKHRARELADHFAAQPAQEPVAWAVQACSKMWRGEFAEIDAKAEAKRCGGTCVAYPLYTAPAQREWQSLTDDDWEKVANRKHTVLDTFEQGAVWAADQLEERNG